MDALNRYRQAIKEVLSPYIDLHYAHGNFHNFAVFDEQGDHYMIMSLGWDFGHHTSKKRVHGCLIHLDIIDGKVWVQVDGTEDAIARQLQAAGIPRDCIVLGFHPPEIRVHTGYAVG